MTSTATDPARELLAYAAARRRDALEAEADVLVTALAWAELHPATTLDDAAVVGRECALPVAGPGAPLVAEFCIPELALAIGISTDAGRRLLGDAIELAHRLPRTWARVTSAELPPWRARRIAEHTKSLTLEAAAHVDQHVAAFAHRLTLAALERLVADAIARFDPDTARQHAAAAYERRHVTFFHDQLGPEGTTRMEAELDLADALDLDAALTQGAAQLKALGNEHSLDVRRSLALGDLAHHGEVTLDLPARELVLHLHLTDPDVATLEEHQRTLTVDQVRTWCTRPDTHITIKPVLDLRAELSSAGYQPSDRLAEQTILKDRTCVFPHCSRPARTADLDHITAYADGGVTTTHNLAPLCRGHHRLKTHSPWTYQPRGPGHYIWTSPHGTTYLREPPPPW